MSTIAITLSLFLSALIIIHACLAWGFVRRLNAPQAAPLTESEYPKSAIVICIRGEDPTLSECLHAALNQDYPDYAVHIVVDSRADPAWPVVTKFVTTNRQTQSKVEVLENPLSTCSLKCSSLIQAISGLHPAYKVIALLDTDIVPHRRWLKDMVSPLAREDVGAATGNRWFAPEPTTLTSLARYAWNAAAVVIMYWLDIAWGGSLAIKRAVIEEGNLLSDWRHTYGDDTAINPALRRAGQKLEFVPSALVTGRSNCELAQLKNWITRQLFSCRLHHRGWRGVLLHGFGTSLALGLALGVFGVGVLGQRWDEIAPLAGALAAYLVTMVGLLAWLNARITKESAPQPSAKASSIWHAFWKLLPSIVLAQLVYVASLFSAVTARTVEWRQARYETAGQGRIRLTEYVPFEPVFGGSRSESRGGTHQCGLSLRKIR